MQIIFFKLFFFIKPIHRQLIRIFCLAADLFYVAVTLLITQFWVNFLLWAGVIILNLFILIEDILSKYFYQKNLRQIAPKIQMSQSTDLGNGSKQIPSNDPQTVNVVSPDCPQHLISQNIPTGKGCDLHCNASKQTLTNSVPQLNLSIDTNKGNLDDSKDLIMIQNQ